MDGMAGIEAFGGYALMQVSGIRRPRIRAFLTGAGTRRSVAAQPSRLTMGYEEPGGRHREYTRFLYFVTMFMILGKRREENNATIP